MDRHAIVVLHHACDLPGAIATALAERGLATRTIATHDGDVVPRDLGGASALVVMGGPFGANDDRAHLDEERALVRVAASANAAVLGVCLGSQIVATALGAKVRTLPSKEIGWYEVAIEDAAKSDSLFSVLRAPFVPFSWHGDGFELPPGATQLARSAKTPVQAFHLGRTYALQFHLEMTGPMIALMADRFSSELADEGVDRAALDRETRARMATQESTARAFFGAWAAGI